MADLDRAAIIAAREVGDYGALASHIPALLRALDSSNIENNLLRAQLNTAKDHLRLAVDCLRTAVDHDA